MKCLNCDRIIEKALELCNGDLRCPYCGASIVPDEGKVKVTADNTELYNLSRANFCTYLEKASSFTGTTDKKTKEEADGYLRRAVSFCEQAAHDLHPEALVDLGYYYSKDYINYDLVGVGRYKTAYSYFKCILDDKKYDDIVGAYNGYTAPAGYAGRKRGSADDEASRVVTKAAYYLLDMISSAPAEFAEEKEYTLINAKELISQNPHVKLADAGDFRLMEKEDSTTENRLQSIEKTLEHCRERSSNHAPLFGFFDITGMTIGDGSESDTSEYKRLKTLIAKNRRRIVMGYLYETGGRLEWGEVDNPEIERLMRENSGKSYGMKMYFYFFSRNAASKVYKKGVNIRAMERELIDKAKGSSLEGMAQVVSGMSGSSRKEQVFYWDDAYFITANRSKFKREGGGRDYTTADGFLMIISGEYLEAMK